MDEDAGMVHPGRQAAWWTRPPVLLLTGVGVLIVVLAVLFLADMAQRQQPGPEDVAAGQTPATTASGGPDSVTSTVLASPSSTTSPSASSDRPRSLSTSTVAKTPTSSSTSPVSATTATSTDPSTATTASSSSTAVSSTPTPTSTALTTRAAPTTRAAALTAPALTQGAFTAHAGSTFRAIFTVTNTSGTGSGPRTVTVSAPPGVTIADVGIALSPARAGLRGPAAALAPAAPPAARTASASINCLGTNCTYTVPPHMTITVTLTLDVAPTAASGVLQLSAAGYAPSRATLTVQSTVASPAGPVTSTSTPATTVTDPTDATPAASTADDAPDGADTTG